MQRRLDMTEGTYVDNLQDLTDSIEHLNVETTPVTSIHNERIDPIDDGADDFWCEDGALNGLLGAGLSHAYVLNREWKRRHDQFHTMGYRDGITGGKEASAQGGFNVGFKQAVHVGHKWGLVRGISSAMTSLPDHLKENLSGTPENKDRLRNLYEFVQTISSNDALRIFYESYKQTATRQSDDHYEGNFCESIEGNEDLGCNQLEKLFTELTSLLHEAPEIGCNGWINFLHISVEIISSVILWFNIYCKNILTFVDQIVNKCAFFLFKSGI